MSTFDEKIQKIVEDLWDKAGDAGFFALSGVTLIRANETKSRVVLKLRWDTITFECLEFLTKVFGTKDIDFTGNSKTTYPYSEYTPIPVHEGVIRIDGVKLGEDAL